MAEYNESISKEPIELSQEQLNESYEIFDLFDTDGSGLIYVDTLGIALRALGWVLSEADVRRLQTDFIVNGSSTLEFADFLKIVSHRPTCEPDSEQQLRTAFSSFDHDGSGQVSLTELRHLLTNSGEMLTDAEINAMINDLVATGDGQINFEEMVQMMK